VCPVDRRANDQSSKKTRANNQLQCKRGQMIKVQLKEGQAKNKSPSTFLTK
jgi:hypothetical protein